MNLKDQVLKAIDLADAEFYVGGRPPIPADATLQSLWDEILILRKMVKKPKVVHIVRLLLEDPELSGIPIPVIADLLRNVYAAHKMTCKTTENCVRWYISQNTMLWDIQPRSKFVVDTRASEETS